MSLKKKEYFYITTPIYYINDEPHIGHFYSTVAADVLARYHRLIGDNVFFSTGIDENSQKTLQAAQKQNIDVVKFTDIMAEKWQRAWKVLDISHDVFIRTTTPEHKESVKKILMKCYEQGDIYKKHYEGLYCVGCEKFLTEVDIVDDKCNIHKTKPEWVKEENYFFKLSKYEKPLWKLLNQKDFALPEFRRNEMLEFIKSGLQDISISRVKKEWGIPFPIDASHVIYVWFDALTNYITALGYYKDDAMMDKYWKEAIHLVGKDIYRFHTLLWPAMLISAGLTPPKQVFGHGYFTLNGEKISKSLGNAIDPIELSKKYTVDAIKYFMLKEIPFGKDSDFSTKRLEQRYQGDLADDLGNLLNRSLNMVEKYNQGIVPEYDKHIHNKNIIHKTIQEKGEQLVESMEEHYKKFEFSQLLEEIWVYIKSINKYIDSTKPWKLYNEKNTVELNVVLYNLIQALKLIALYIYPVLPQTANRIFSQLGIDKKVEDMDYLKETKWGTVKPGMKTKKGELLFPLLQEKKMEEKIEAPKEELIDIEHFKKIDLRVAEVLKAERLPDTEKLIKLEISLGEEKRTLLAGIAQHYKPEELVGKKIIVIKNLQPRKMRGIESQGMLLAASNDKGELSILTVEHDVAIGSKIS